jgi:hypothetical protein
MQYQVDRLSQRRSTCFFFSETFQLLEIFAICLLSVHIPLKQLRYNAYITK